MNKKRIISIVLLVIFVLSSLMPIMEVSALTNEAITFNSALYKAVKAELETKGIYANYNDVQYTMTLSQDAINSITELNLSNNEISDLTGLDKFVNVTSVDLSANELTKESNLEVLNSFNLKFLDLSSNEISDVSMISGINEIETVNLHNQKFNEAIIITNSVVKDGTYKVECELPEIIKDFAKPIKSAWLNDSYLPSGTSVKFDWYSFNSSSDSVKLKIGDTSGEFNGLATLKIKIDDMSNKLYNSEITLNYVVVDEDQRGIAIKDKNLYEAIKEQLTKGQNVNSNLTHYTSSSNLYDQAYDEQMIFVININDLVNKITSLVLDNKRIEDLSGIEMFIGLEKELNVSSNYIDTIDRVVDLQKMKDTEETALQERFKEKASQINERIEELEKNKTELETAKKSLNEIKKELENAENKVGEANNSISTLEAQKKEAELKLNSDKVELDSVIETYNQLVERYNNEVKETDIDSIADSINGFLTKFKAYGNKYIEYSGEKIILFQGETVKYSALELNALTIDDINANYDYADYSKLFATISLPTEYKTGIIAEDNKKIAEIETKIKESEATQTTATQTKESVQEKYTEITKKITNLENEIKRITKIIISKTQEIYNMYNGLHKVTSIITSELKNITDEDYNNLNLERASALLQAQVTKINSIEKYFNSEEKDYLSSIYGIDFENEETGTPVAKYFSELLKSLSEDKDVRKYRDELEKLRKMDAYFTVTNYCTLYKKYENSSTCVLKNNTIKEIEYSIEDEETITQSILEFGNTTHKSKGEVTANDEYLLALAGRIAKATDTDIASYVVLPRLRSLNMNENLIENMDEISIMKELRTLNMGQNEIVNINNIDWSAMPKIHTLNLAFNNISEIKALEVLKNLKSLDLSKNLISGSLNFTISDMKKLQTLDLSSNQIDDIEYLKAQYEFIAKDKNVEVSDLIVPIVNLQSQSLSLQATVEQNTALMKIELPKIFSQLEELQWKNTSFGINSLYGNVTSDGKYVSLDISTTGTKNANVTVIGGIGSGTNCSIVYKVVEEFDRTLPEVSFETNGGNYTLKDGKATISTKVTVTDNEQVESAEYVWATSNKDKQTEYVEMDNFTNKEISMEVTEAGTWYLWVKATDASGNVIEQCSDAFVVTITENEENNKTSPEVSFETNGGNYTLKDGKAIISTKVTVTDNEQVESAEYVWATSNKDKQTEYVAMDNFTNQEVSMEVTETGTWYLWIKATDASGNVTEQCSEAFVVIDSENQNPSEITITINTNEGSNIEAIKEINNINYIVVSKDTTVSQVLSDITLNTGDYNLVVKDSELENILTENEKLKTNVSVVVDGFENKAQCVIVVKGDVDGDGDIDMSDVLKLNEAKNQKNKLTDAEFLAGNVEDSNDEIDMSDILKLNQYRNNKITNL